MIGERELEQASADSAVDHQGGDALSYLMADISLRVVQSYALRYAKVCEAAEKSYEQAAAGGFLLGFELGVRASRIDHADA